MPGRDAIQIKERIISMFMRKGPSLPVHVAKETGLSILFASAFLSEMISDGKIKISFMRVGSSPIYFLPGQEYSLEKFSEYLKNKEKEAFNLLRERKLLKDSEQEPAIRFALREIKDFAMPLSINEENYWRYVTYPESEIKKEKKIEHSNKKEEIAKEEEINKKEITPEKEEKKKRVPQKKKEKKISGKNENFFNKIKEFLAKKDIGIEDIIDFNKNEIILKVKKMEENLIIVAYNKKRINEEDVIKANKKALELSSKYLILSLGDV